MNVGRVVCAVAGMVLLAAASALTVWASIAEKSISAVGIGGMFVVSVLLSIAGLLDMRPSSLAFGKDGVTLQLIADAVRDVKQSAAEEATKIATDPNVRDAVVGAKTGNDAEKVAADISQRIVQALPATADLTRKALDAMS
jgi:hypothetical protein